MSHTHPVEFVRSVLFGATLLALPAVALSQNQALYFDGTSQYAEFNAPAGMPSGSSPRTVEFWLRAERGSEDNRQSIIDLGEQRFAGSAFGIQLEYVNGVPQLGFWGHNMDRRFLFAIPDDEWHFVAVTYEEPRLTIYLDAETKFSEDLRWPDRKVNTAVGRCFIGGNPNRNWYFRGAIDNVAIWNVALRYDEIARHMTSFPPLNGQENGLVASFRFDEGRGDVFLDATGRTTGRLRNSPLWTQTIAARPTPLSEGIWFVIQNRDEVATDMAIPARRMALRSDGAGRAPYLAAIPLAGPYDAFLWRAVRLAPAATFQLINKQAGASSPLALADVDPAASAQPSQDGRAWRIAPMDVATLGTNVYSVTSQVTPTRVQALSLSNGKIVMATPGNRDQRQAWVFQPMSLKVGFHIPSPTPLVYPYTKALDLAFGYQLRATNTVSDWAVLNAHNVYENMLNAIKNKRLKFRGQDTMRRNITMLSEYDQLPCSYPGLVASDCGYIMDKRGWGDGPGEGSGITLITEELMGRTGVFSRGFKLPDVTDHSEFDQVVHEFAHTLDDQLFYASKIAAYAERYYPKQCSPSAALCSSLVPDSRRIEWFPWEVQKWFHSSVVNPESPKRLAGRTEVGDRRYLERFFDFRNTWIPPRTLRDAAGGRPYRFAVNETVITKDPRKVIFSGDGASKMFLDDGGSLVVTAVAAPARKWDAGSSLGAAAQGVEAVLYSRGWLVFLGTDDPGKVDQAIEAMNQPENQPDDLASLNLPAGALLGGVKLHPMVENGRVIEGFRLVVNDGGFPQVLGFDVDGNDGITVLWSAR